MFFFIEINIYLNEIKGEAIQDRVKQKHRFVYRTAAYKVIMSPLCIHSLYRSQTHLQTC